MVGKDNGCMKWNVKIQYEYKTCLKFGTHFHGKRQISDISLSQHSCTITV